MTIYTVDWPSFLKKKEVIYHYNFYYMNLSRVEGNIGGLLNSLPVG